MSHAKKTRDYRISNEKTEGIVKIDGFYLMWSKEKNMPVTDGMPLEKFKEYYLKSHPKTSESSLDFKLNRVEKTGSSFISDNLKILLFSCPLTKEEIIEDYC
ncbi:MAG: hypothetical protein JSV92_03740 [archaeon]|nr:MAG: hypothetical protein JSV92_03740 [archaeon]